MTTGYVALAEVAESLRRQLEALSVFDSVAVAAVDSFGKLAETVRALAAPCKAVVMLGSADYDAHGLKRVVRGAVAVVAPVRIGAESRAESVWKLVDAAAGLLTPQLCPGGAPALPAAAGCPVLLTGWAPVNIDAKSACVALAIEVTQLARVL
ncbi:MAG: hypothetical protein PHI85_04005 [Victivallaceae bacterium]|nr:hypothetical protein [Victivallaceae bacterium]